MDGNQDRESGAECPAGISGPTAANSPPLTDSPWFWVYVFATAGLVALFLATPRYGDRQPQLERQFAARQSGGQVVVGRSGPIPPSTRERMIVSLRPLFAFCALLLTVAWLVLWKQRYRQIRRRSTRHSIGSTVGGQSKGGT